MRPRIDDMPETVDNRQLLLEMRQHTHEWREWRDSVNGDIAFLKRLRWSLAVAGPRAGAGVLAIFGTLVALYAACQ